MSRAEHNHEKGYSITIACTVARIALLTRLAEITPSLCICRQNSKQSWT
jgi:hypothetical protein